MHRLFYIVVGVVGGVAAAWPDPFASTAAIFAARCATLIPSLVRLTHTHESSFFAYSCAMKHNTTWPYCGGFGDRTRGIITTLYLAITHNRAFYLDSSFPDRLQRYFVPLLPNYSWVPPSTTTDPFAHALHVPMHIVDFARIHLEPRVVFVPTNNLLYLGPADEHIAYCLINFILQPSPYLLSHINPVLAALGPAFVAIHIRIGSNATWEDPAVVPIAHIHSFFECAIAVQPAKSTKWLLLSDSHRVTTHAQLVYGPHKIVLVPGAIVHVDRSQPSSDPTRSYVEHVLIAAAAHTVASPSGFSKYANIRGAYKPIYTYPFPAPGCTPQSSTT